MVLFKQLHLLVSLNGMQVESGQTMGVLVRKTSHNHLCCAHAGRLFSLLLAVNVHSLIVQGSIGNLLRKPKLDLYNFAHPLL